MTISVLVPKLYHNTILDCDLNIFPLLVRFIDENCTHDVECERGSGTLTHCENGTCVCDDSDHGENETCVETGKSSYQNCLWVVSRFFIIKGGFCLWVVYKN